MELVKTFSKAWKIKEIRQKIIFTLLMLLVFRIGSNIPVPGINREYLAQMFSGQTGLLDLFDLFSGGAFSNFTIFALSITPYVTASIIVQLLTIAFPYFERLAREGTEGRKKMATITRYMTVALGLIQAIGLTVGLFRRAIVDQSAFNMIVIISSQKRNSTGQGRSSISSSGDRTPYCCSTRHNGDHRNAAGRQKDPGTVCKACSRKKDVRRPVDPHSYEGQSGRRNSDHLLDIASAVPSDNYIFCT